MGLDQGVCNQTMPQGVGHFVGFGDLGPNWLNFQCSHISLRCGWWGFTLTPTYGKFHNPGPSQRNTVNNFNKHLTHAMVMAWFASTIPVSSYENMISWHHSFSFLLPVLGNEVCFLPSHIFDAPCLGLSWWLYVADHYKFCRRVYIQHVVVVHPHHMIAFDMLWVILTSASPIIGLQCRQHTFNKGLPLIRAKFTMIFLCALYSQIVTFMNLSTCNPRVANECRHLISWNRLFHHVYRTKYAFCSLN